jgi:hypothetical protein
MEALNNQEENTVFNVMSNNQEEINFSNKSLNNHEEINIFNKIVINQEEIMQVMNILKRIFTIEYINNKNECKETINYFETIIERNKSMFHEMNDKELLSYKDVFTYYEKCNNFEEVLLVNEIIELYLKYNSLHIQNKYIYDYPQEKIIFFGNLGSVILKDEKQINLICDLKKEEYSLLKKYKILQNIEDYFGTYECIIRGKSHFDFIFVPLECKNNNNEIEYTFNREHSENILYGNNNNFSDKDNKMDISDTNSDEGSDTNEKNENCVVYYAPNNSYYFKNKDNKGFFVILNLLKLLK